MTVIPHATAQGHLLLVIMSYQARSLILILTPLKFLTVEVRINNKLATAIIDTGAQASLISSQLVDK